MPTFVTRYLHHHKFIGRIADFAVNRTSDWPDYRNQLSTEIHRVQKTVHIGINATARRFSQRDENGIWHGEETEAVLKPEIVHERMQQLSGEWVTVGTGWQAWPDLGKESGLVLRDGEVLLPAAEDMLPIACQMFAEGKTVAVEHAEPVYLRNNVAWKKLPGKE
jgi:hypothetical protein